jgi:outer membrane receptor protein involved in Fe transport
MRFGVAVAVACLSIIGLSQADQVRASIRKDSNISPGGLGPALQTLAKEYQFQILYRTELVGSLRTHGVVGQFTSDEALKQVLSGTGLTYRYLDEKTVTIVPVAWSSATSEGDNSVSQAAIGGVGVAKATQDAGQESIWDEFRVAQVNQGKAPSDSSVAQALTKRESEGGLQEVIVTAQKRSERLQDVPIAVSALTGDMLEEMGAQSFTDYARTVPGLRFTDYGAGRQTPSIRGVNATFGAATVTYYIGETPLGVVAQGSVVNPTLIDIDRIEVLRGPQGTLYGSSSIGGTIKLIPHAPNLTQLGGAVEASAQITQGADGASPGGTADIVLNAPIVQGVLGMRVVAWGRDVGGFVNRTWDTPQEGFVGNIPVEHTWGFRATALYQPVEQLSISAMVYLQNQHFNGYEDYTGGASNPDNRLVQNFIVDVSEPQETQFRLYDITMSYSPGLFNIVSATTYQDIVSNWTEEGTSLIQAYLGGPPFPTLVQELDKSHDFTEEFRLSTSQAIHGFAPTLGVFYSQYHSSGGIVPWAPPEYNELVANNDPSNPLYAPGNLLYTQQDITNQREFSEFGELTYHFTDRLSVTGGFRHYDISTDRNGYGAGLFATGSDVPVYATASGAWRGFVYKGDLSYKVTPDHLVYAQYAEGFRPGYPTGKVTVPPTCQGEAPPDFGQQVNPDSIKSYELGAKTAWLNKRLTANAAVYRIDWTDIQQAALLPCGFAANSNIGSALVKGVELDVNGRLTSRVAAGLSGGYVRAQLQQTNNLSGALAGDQIQNVPEWQYALYATTSFPILESADGFARVDYQYTGHSFGFYMRARSPDGTPYGPIDPTYELQVTRLLNGRVGMHHGPWELSFSGANLLNNVVRQGTDANADLTLPIPGRPRYLVNRPRTFFLNASYQF